MASIVCRFSLHCVSLAQWLASIVRTGSRPGGCPRPMRRGWLRRNRLIPTLPYPDSSVREGLAFAPARQRSCFRQNALSMSAELQNQSHFFGEASERRPWASKREDRPAAFAGRSEWVFPGRDTGRAYTGEYPIPPTRSAAIVRRSGRTGIREISRKILENLGGKDRDSLQECLKRSLRAGSASVNRSSAGTKRRNTKPWR
jgi:hypothetical protein